ncbi:hypothetical protein [Daejeonella sp. H1SJ63]|jgi:succinate dehydrogenase hydrophobic anchor subunit|uniref:hypothetical protein n=1 Tax=Daejeonella sp. H1SJ63 TaxID=3034145 RepID=UPI0023ED30B4|nr:hypothetical protein [Daejeonella sp. H1SJ63]
MKELISLQIQQSMFKREHLGIFSALLLFLCFPWLSRWIDITSAPIDPGALSAVIMAILSLLAFKAVTWWLINIIWPVLADYSEEQFEQNFKSLSAWQKVIIYLGFYLLLLYSFVATLAAII